MSEWFNQYPVVEQAPQNQWWQEMPAVQIAPYAEREIKKAQDDYTRASSSGMYDEDQLEELRGKVIGRVDRLRRDGAVDLPPESPLSEMFDRQVVERDGRLFQQDPQTGQFSVLSEPQQDMRNLEEMEFDQQAKREDLRNKFIQQRASMTTADGSPMFTMEQILTDANQMFQQRPSVQEMSSN